MRLFLATWLALLLAAPPAAAADISTWDPAAANNNSAAPDGFPENMAPSGVNDAAREVMASVRRWYEDADWRDLGHTVADASATSFTVTGIDVTDEYVPGRRVRLTDSSTLYGVVVSSSFSSNTTVNVALDSGSISGSLSAAALGPKPAALPGSWIPLNQKVASNDATVDFVLPTGFRAIRFILIDVVPANDGVGLNFRTSTDGGSNFAESAGDYQNSALRMPSDAAVAEARDTNATAIQLGSSIGSAAGEGLSGHVIIFNPAGTALNKLVEHKTMYTDDGGSPAFHMGGGARMAAADIDAVRFVFSAGTAESGTIVMQGLR